tara:strand:- start:45 stop:818 length:774 start_codon:yes stop_codon:yes gene_type:complete
VPSYREATIETVHQFVEFIDSAKKQNARSGNSADFLFRGQNQDYPLLPKLARLNLRGEIKKIESLMLDEFERMVLPLSEFQPKDKWDLLALAQHHGLPTRLMDWTFNAMAALWFAVARPPATSSKYGTVWILAADVEDFRSDTEKYGPLSNRITRIFRPKIVSRRISAQAGAFTVHRIMDGNRIIRFETNHRLSRKLTKVLIPSTHFAAIRQQLDMLGVNHAALFPDIDGLCSHLEWRYAFYQDEYTSRKAKKNYSK